jgi:outer membrane murein-binding lipoprotein Lpp
MVISALIAAGAAIYGSAVTSKDKQTAGNEVRDLNNQQIAMQQEQNAFAEKTTNSQLGLNRAQLAETNRMNNEKISQDQLTQFQNLLNSNVGLRNSVVAAWGRVGG